MPLIAISTATKKRLAQSATERGLTVDALLESLLGDEESRQEFLAHPLAVYLQTPEFRAKFSDAERYLAILAWVARNHAAEFGDFIEHLESGRRYLGLSPEQIRETCHHNQARPVPGTHFWAIMNLDTPTRRRFLRRLFVFVGIDDAMIGLVTATLGRRIGG